MPREIELKLGLAKRALPALRRHPLITGCEPLGNTVTLENVYYDTPDLELKGRRLALRTRRQGRRWLQTVKAASASTGGLSSRPEWEQLYDTRTGFDFAAVDAPVIRKLLERHADALVPVFTTRFRRETRVYAPAEGVRILVMIDTGTVTAGERSTELCEVELELAAGDATDLLKLATQLAADLPLIPEDVSKAERGYRLHLDQPQKPVRARASNIDPGQTPVEAFRTLAFDCMQQWQANAAGAARLANPEFIHQLRVSQRRLRSLISLFAPALPETFVTHWSAELKQNANRFGTARDLDVLEDELLEGVCATSTHEATLLAELRTCVATARADARKQVTAALDPAEQGKLLLQLNSDLHTLPTNHLIGAVDPHTFAALQLEHLRRRARKRLKAARDGVPEHLHALRIAFKRLRYGVEFFEPLLPKKATAAYLDTLAEVQTALGFINDLDVARQRFAEWGKSDSQLCEAAAYVCGWHGKRYTKLTRRSLREAPPLLTEKLVPWAELIPEQRRTSAA